MIITEIAQALDCSNTTRRKCIKADFALSVTSLVIGLLGLFAVIAMPPVGSGILIGAGGLGILLMMRSCKRETKRSYFNWKNNVNM